MKVRVPDGRLLDGRSLGVRCRVTKGRVFRVMGQVSDSMALGIRIRVLDGKALRAWVPKVRVFGLSLRLQKIRHLVLGF